MKKITYVWLLLFMLFLPLGVQASTNTLDRESLENYGVNKHWKITDSNRSNVLNTYAVDAKEKVYDFADILTEEEENEFYHLISDFIEKYNTDVVFVSVNLPYYTDKINEDWAADFYDYNDFGISFEKYDGILLYRNTYESDPYYNIYVFGDAQLYIDYNRSETILDNIYDNFHSGLYLDDFRQFMDDLESDYKSGIPSSMEHYYVTEDGYLKKEYVTPWGGIIVVDLIVVGIVMLILIKKNKMVRKKLNTMSYVNKNSIHFRQQYDRFVNSHTTSYVHTSSSSGGGHFSGGSSGGGHFSGGGRHG